MNNPLASPNDYARFLHQLPTRYPFIRHSSLVYIRALPLPTLPGFAQEFKAKLCQVRAKLRFVSF